MKSQLSVIVLCLLVVLPCIAIAQTRREPQAGETAEPPRSLQHAFTHAGQHDEVIARLFAFQPAMPLGPVDVLKGYEDGMILITQKLSADLISISQAHQSNQLTRDEAEYLIHERYQVAMMQHEVLSALHDSLKHDLALAAKRPGRVSQSDTAVVAQPPLSGQGQN